MDARLRSVVVAVAVLVVAAVVAAAVGLGTAGATAVCVGDRTVSKSALDGQLAEWADLEAAGIRTTAGAVSADAGATVTTFAVYELLIERFLARVGETVLSEDRQLARAAAGQVPGFADQPASFRTRYVEQQAAFAALGRLVGTDDQGEAALRVLRREARRSGVEVAPVYGRWSPVRVAVVPVVPPPVR
jgi:hypothetical protein